MYVCTWVKLMAAITENPFSRFLPFYHKMKDFLAREREREEGNGLLSLLNRSMQALSIVHLRATVQWLSSNVQMANRNDVETNTTMCLMYS